MPDENDPISQSIKPFIGRRVRLWVGFSGGIDSTALLHSLVMNCNNSDIIAIHVNHNMQKDSYLWQHHCEEFSKKLNINFVSENVTVTGNKGRSLEDIARELRYQVFSKYINAKDHLLLAHHANDVAETAISRLCEGANIRGMGSIPAQRTHNDFTITRPFINLTKDIIKAYIKKHNLKYIDDASNLDTKIRRNAVRHYIIPQLNRVWPNAINSISKATNHIQEANQLLYDLANIDLNYLTIDNKIFLPKFSILTPARQRNVILHWLDRHSVARISHKKLSSGLDNLLIAGIDKIPYISWNSNSIRRYQNKLYLLTILPQNLSNISYILHHKLFTKIPGSNFKLSYSKSGVDQQYVDHLEIRFRRGGEKIFNGEIHRKLKKLMQEWGLPPWERGAIPLLYYKETLIAVADYIYDPRYIVNNDKSIKIIKI